MKIKRRVLLATCCLLVVFFIGIAPGKGRCVPFRFKGWYGNNARILSQMIGLYGKGGEKYDPAHPPVAAFDWDNTVIKNDVGDAVTFWMLANNKILQPPKKDWRRTSPLLTDEAVHALHQACSSQGEAGQPLTTNAADPKSMACADEILAIYDGGKTTADANAWKEGAQNNTMDPENAWTISLTRGYTPAEIKNFAEEAIDSNLSGGMGAFQTIGSKKNATAYVRLYDPMRNLIATLQAAGFDVWVISASPQPWVEAFAARVGIAADHVIGIRAVLDENGRVVAAFQACGSFPDGNYDLIPYRQGKRCWLNKVAFGRTTPRSQMEERSPLVFAAGDSDVDLYFLRDARYRLVLNRNKTELMCHAYAAINHAVPSDGVWMINPMFIKPKPKKREPYDCSKYGFPDQVDSVY